MSVCRPDVDAFLRELSQSQLYELLGFQLSEQPGYVAEPDGKGLSSDQIAAGLGVK